MTACRLCLLLLLAAVDLALAGLGGWLVFNVARGLWDASKGGGT